MSGALLAQLGWKEAALAISSVFGTTWAQYRPTGALLPWTGTLINAALPGYVTPDAYTRKPKPFDPAKPKAHAVFDPAVLAVGDYLAGSITQGGTQEAFFVANLQAPAPPGATRCNAVADFTRGVVPTEFGAQPALDMQIGNETVLAQGWPISVLREGRGERGDTNLPSDVKLGGFICLVPLSIPTDLRSGDVLTINTWLDNPNAPGGVRLIVAMAEGGPDGWKLLAQQATT